MTSNNYKQITWEQAAGLAPSTPDVELPAPSVETSALNRFSLRGRLADLQKRTVEAVPILDNLVLQGQFSLVYAQSNTGKTLITLSWIINAIESEALNPDKVYYLNLDDSGKGLLTKLSFAEEFGFHMLAEGEAGFRASNFQEILKELLRNDQCFGRVIIADTLKKLIDVMDKSKVREFTGLVRNFVQRGGTFLALAHTNKRPDVNGRAVYGGVSDFLDDADCAYIAITAEAPDTDSKLVVFENIKKRGDVDSSAAFKYSIQSGISYEELVTSVEKVKLEQLDQFKVLAEKRTDAEVISAAVESISNGINTKMKLVTELRKKMGISKRAAIKVVEKYTGVEPGQHYWNYTMKGHGAQQYELI